MPFGLAVVCRIYTTVQGEVYMPFRPKSQNITFLIDDVLFAFGRRKQELHRTMTLLLMLTALGFHLSWDKCELLPVRCGKFFRSRSRHCSMSKVRACRQKQPASNQQALQVCSCLLPQLFTWHQYSCQILTMQCNQRHAGTPWWHS